MGGGSRSGSLKMERKLRCESSREDERRPWLWLLAGPNGAGKSTYAPKLAALVDEIVRPDELAYQLSREAPERVALAAGRLAVRRINELLEQRRSFAIETTLSGRLHLQVVERATRAEWSIGVVYIALGSPELAVERVRERTSRGGHYVPANDVRRRFARSLDEPVQNLDPRRKTGENRDGKRRRKFRAADVQFRHGAAGLSGPARLGVGHDWAGSALRRWLVD